MTGLTIILLIGAMFAACMMFVYAIDMIHEYITLGENFFIASFELAISLLIIAASLATIVKYCIA